MDPLLSYRPDLLDVPAQPGGVFAFDEVTLEAPEARQGEMDTSSSGSDAPPEQWGAKSARKP
jgi:hypothetical protein